eukprot:354312-Amphidinium_carterae.2
MNQTGSATTVRSATSLRPTTVRDFAGGHHAHDSIMQLKAVTHADTRCIDVPCDSHRLPSLERQQQCPPAHCMSTCPKPCPMTNSLKRT